MPAVLEENKTLAGHLPAEKVGGMRVMRKDRPKSENENTTPSDGGSESGKSDEFKQAENVLAHTGLAAQMPWEYCIYRKPDKLQTNKDYPDVAVKHYHDKPVPRNQVQNTQPINCRASGPIFQPTKQ